MRTQNPFAIHRGALIGAYSERFAEAIAVRRAELEARAARAEAELSIRARSEFLANMNHELRTPLNAIIGFATMLKESDAYPLSEEQRRSYADYVLQSADLLLSHINTILETAALDSASVEIRKDDFDLTTILKEAVERAGTAAAAAGIAIENKSAGDALHVTGDRERLGRAIDHLLRTALRASPEKGTVYVRASASGAGPEIAIRDRGAGLTDEEIKSALNAFSEVNRGLDRSFAGPGVGLAIAKTFVEMQGGRFDIKSRVGQGTIIRLLMPPTAVDPARSDRASPLQKAG